jgi:3-deoxy-manno-octulosonate cytidylyltransferase (CMP-KDO synthetase)
MYNIAIIPARMGSSRFPGKPLAAIHGMPMIGHVLKRTTLCKKLTDTYVATCDTIIKDYIHSIGGKAIMTADSHERCTDRTAEALLKIENQNDQKLDIVVMVQGDEPMVTPHMIDLAIKPLIDNKDLNVVNLMGELNSVDEFENPNEVKVVVDGQSNALYFSREPIPSRKKGARRVTMNKQVCIIPFRRDYLLKFNSMPETPLERIESVDMLRILEHGEKVRMVKIDTVNKSVDTPEDLKQAADLMKNDQLMKAYIHQAGR